MITKNRNELWKTTFPFVIISIIIFIFNIISIWNFDGLFQDDQEYYFRLFNKNVSDLTFQRNIIHAIYTLEIIKIATLTSIFSARFLIIVLLSIPCAFLVYYFTHYHYQLRISTSIAVAVIPFILPNEVLVPTYMVGSYMLPAIIFTFITIYFILKFSKQSKFSITDYILAATFYFLAIESSELMALMLPVFLFLIFIFRKLSVKQFVLGSTFTFMAVVKAILVIIKPHGPVNNVRNEIPVSEIKRRIIHFLDFMNPFHGLTNIGILNIILISIIIVGVIIVIVNHKRLKNILNLNSSKEQPVNKYFYVVYYYLFPLVWLVFSSLPFLFFSQSFGSRYFSTAAIALNFLLIISISVIVGLFTNRKMPLVIILVLILAVSGFNRQQNFRKYYQTLKNQFSELKQTLNNYVLPQNTQIVVTSSNRSLAIGYGITRRSNGALQYILKRRDVTGQIMIEKNFYDPFQIFNKPWEFRSMDIDTLKNTYLFRCFHADSSKNMRLNYALRWEDDKSKESHWSIFHFDEQGNATTLISGNGYESYESTVDSFSELEITRKEILFGGIPAREDSLRLGL